MMFSAKTMLGYAIQARDGMLGTVSDLLFDDRNWRIRWLVIDTGTLLPGRKILLHPSAVGQTVHDQEELLVSLTRAQVRDSPALATDQPVSAQVQAHVNDYYGWDPHWGTQTFGAGAIASPLSPPPLYDAGVPDEALLDVGDETAGDPHLCSVTAAFGAAIDEPDGAIGHATDFRVDDRSWAIRYMVAETGHWWHGAAVLVSPGAVVGFDWAARRIEIRLTRAQLRASPPWDPNAGIEPAYEDQLRAHYGWADGNDGPALS